MSKTILVTGGAGYIGSHTNLELLSQGYETIIFDSLSAGNTPYIDNRSAFVEGNLLNLEDLENLFKRFKIDGIIHFAASIEVGESQINPEKYYINNVVGTLNLLKVARANKVNNLVFSSTAATYGAPISIPLFENMEARPINTYGRTKLIVENILADYHRAYGFKSISLRYFNACGADPEGRTGENHDPESHLIPILLKSLKYGTPELKVYGQDYNTSDGTCIRDYIHVVDLAKAHILALEKLMSNEIELDVFNLGTGNGFSILEIFKTAEKVTGLKPKYTFTERRAGDPDVLIANVDKAKKVLGWTPQNSSLEFILKTAWKWVEKNNK